jgi:DNA-binding MarR family transcriptional regulator
MDMVRALVRRFSIAERADTGCCGVTVAQAATLETLRDQGRMRLGDLGRRLGISPSTLTRNIARLRERGLVTTRTDRDDRRASTIELTTNGLRAAEQVRQQEEAFFGLVLEQLPGDQADEALAALEMLWSALRTATEECCPGAFDHLMTSPSTLPAGGKKGTENVCTTC